MASYCEGNVLYEDIESLQPETDETSAARARKVLVELDGVPALAPLLSSPVTNVVVSASGALFNAALSVAGANRIRAEPGLVAALLGAGGLAHADARVRGNAAGVLQNVAAHSDAGREQLADAGALGALLTLIAAEAVGAAGSGGDVAVLARAVGALSNLALLEGNARALCAPKAVTPAPAQPSAPTALGALSLLLEVVQSSTREDTLEDASHALVRILTVEPAARSELVTLDGLPAVQGLIAALDDELQLRGCELLQMCALSDARTHTFALAAALVGLLVERLGSASEEVQEAAVRAITALFVRPAFGRAFRKADGIGGLVALLAASKDVPLLAACLYCLGQLARTDGPSRALIRDEGGLESTSRLLTHGSRAIATAAAHVLRYAALNEDVRRAVREAGALPTLSALLAAGEADVALTTAVLGALANLVLHEPESGAIVRRARGFEAAAPLLAARDAELALLAARLFERGVSGAPDNRTHFRLIGALRSFVLHLGCDEPARRLALVGALAHSAHTDAPNQVRLRELGAAAGLVALLRLPAAVDRLTADGARAPDTRGGLGEGPGGDGAHGSPGCGDFYADERERSDEQRRRACWALSHLACEPLGAAAVREAGGHEAILSLLRTSDDGGGSASPSAGLVAAGTSCLFNCAMHDGRASAPGLVAAGAVQFALATLDAARARADVDSAAYAAGILMNLCLAHAAAAEQLGAADGSAALLECVAPRMPPMLNCNAAGALCNAAAASPQLARRIVELGAVGTVVALIDPSSSEQPPAVVDQAGALLANLAALPEGRDAGADAGVPRVAVELLDDPSEVVRTVAARSLAHLAVSHERNCAASADAGALGALLGILALGPAQTVLDVTTHSDAQLACALALANLSVAQPCVEAILEARVDMPAPSGTPRGGAPAFAPTEPAGAPAATLTGLATLVAALALGQPHESIRAKSHAAAALANCAALAEARAAIHAEGLLPAVVGVLAELVRPSTRVKALAQAGGEQRAVANGAEMASLLVQLSASLCMLLRNAALSPACKGALVEQTGAMLLLLSILRSAESAQLLAQAAGALQNLQDRSEARPGNPVNPIGAGERSSLKVHQTKQRLHAAGDDADAPLPDKLRDVDDDTDDAGAGSRTKEEYRLIPAQKLGATHDIKELKGPYTAEPVTLTLTRESAGCSRRQPLEHYEPVPSPLPSAPSSPR